MSFRSSHPEGLVVTNRYGLRVRWNDIEILSEATRWRRHLQAVEPPDTDDTER